MFAKMCLCLILKYKTFCLNATDFLKLKTNSCNNENLPREAQLGSLSNKIVTLPKALSGGRTCTNILLYWKVDT